MFLALQTSHTVCSPVPSFGHLHPCLVFLVDRLMPARHVVLLCELFPCYSSAPSPSLLLLLMYFYLCPVSQLNAHALITSKTDRTLYLGCSWIIIGRSTVR